MIPHDPDFLELTRRLAECEREIDDARTTCRELLHKLTDSRITLEAAAAALRDYDARPVATES